MPQFYSLNSIKWFPKNIDTINGCTYNWAGLRRQVQSVYQSSRLPGKWGKMKELFDEFLCESNSKKLRTIQMTKRERVNFHFHYNCSNLIKCRRTNSLPWSKNRCASIRIIKKSSARTPSKKNNTNKFIECWNWSKWPLAPWPHRPKSLSAIRYQPHSNQITETKGRWRIHFFIPFVPFLFQFSICVYKTKDRNLFDHKWFCTYFF